MVTGDVKAKPAGGAGGQGGGAWSIPDAPILPHGFESVNPLAAWHLARLLAGAADADAALIRETWPTVPLNGGRPDLALVTAWLGTIPDLARAVKGIDPYRLPEVTPATSNVLPGDIPELPAEARLTPSLADDARAVGAWLNDYVDYATRKSPRTPALFHEAAGLFAGGLAIARRLRLPLAHDDVFPNLYILWIAATTLWAKSTALRILTDLTDEAIPHLLLSSEFTPEALLGELAGDEPTGLTNRDEATRNLWTAGRNFAGQRGVVLDEASALFAGFRRDYMAGTAELLLRLYDAPAHYRRNTRGGGYLVIRNAALSFLGATTPASLKRADTAAAWHDGLFPRFVLLTPDCHPVYALGDTRPEPPQAMVGTLKRLTGELLDVPTFPDPPHVRDVVIDCEAHQAWGKYDKALTHDLLTADDAPDGRLWGTYGRLPAQALKVAVILAALDWAGGQLPEPRITLAHWGRGQMIAEQWRASAHRLLAHLADDAGDGEEENRLVRILKRAGKPLTAREVGQYLHKRRDLVEVMLSDLVKDGLAECITDKKVTRYRLRAGT